MAHRIGDDEFLYDLDNLTGMMESSKLLEDQKKTDARPKTSRKRASAKSAGDTKASSTSKETPASSTESSIELEKLKSQNLKLQLEITKAELELAKMKEPKREPEADQRPLSLENVLTSTPANKSGSSHVATADFPTLSQLRDKKKPGASLPHNYVFSSKGTLSYDVLDIPDFVYGYLEFYKEQSAAAKLALIKHLQLLMERAATQNWVVI